MKKIPKYYHIQYSGFNRPSWIIGKQYETSKENFNPYYCRLLESFKKNEFQNGETISLLKYSENIFKKDSNRNIISEEFDFKNRYYEFRTNSFEFEGLSRKLFNSLIQYLKWIREDIFEKERKKINQELPSRKHCIWICTDEDLHKWWEIFKDKPDKKILEISLIENNKIHKCDGTLIEINTSPIEDYTINAKKYWTCELNNLADIEILYEGKFKVKTIYNNISEINK